MMHIVDSRHHIYQLKLMLCVTFLRLRRCLRRCLPLIVPSFSLLKHDFHHEADLNTVTGQELPTDPLIFRLQYYLACMKWVGLISKSEQRQVKYLIQ